jgi:hypothetical protein
MARFHSSFLAALLPAALLLAGCCANNTCDCQDSLADAIYFRFRTSGPNSFLSSEVDTVKVVRYPLPITGTVTPAPDSITLVRLPARTADSIVLGNAIPFTSTGRRLNRYRFVLRLQHPARVFGLSGIQLQGSFEADGCCSCYRNSYKAVNINGQAYDITETNQTPVVIELTK